MFFMLLVLKVLLLNLSPIHANIINVESTTNTTSSPTLSPTLLPTIINVNTSLSPTAAPTSAPSLYPTQTPNTSHNDTSSPTLAPSMIIPPFTTTHGTDITPTHQLYVNFTVNFTSPVTSTVYTMDKSLKCAYSSVSIPANYIQNIIQIKNIETNGNGYYFYDIFSMIDAKDKNQAFEYENQINADPDDQKMSEFARALKEILNANAFDMSTPKMDIISVTSNDGNNDNDTTQIIVWFLGISALCAIGTLILILCWKKFSGHDQDENEKGAINLEFLLDANNSNHANLFSSPMHINDDQEDDDDDDDNANNYNTLNIENDEDLKPIKRKKKKVQPLGRLGADGEDDDDALLPQQDEYEEEDVYDDQDADVDVDDYEPPNFSRI